MEIPGVPESITREAYLSLIAATGLEIKDLRSLEFHYDGIHAEVLSRNDAGHLTINRQKDEVFTHRVFIPVKD